MGGYRLAPDDVMVMPGPLYHNGPFTCSITGLNLGAHLVLLPRFDAEQTLAAIDAHKATWLYVVPTMMSRIWRLPPEVRAKYDVSSLAHRLAHGRALPALAEGSLDRLAGRRDVIMELYAGTEAQAATIISGTEWLEHRGSVGKVAFGEMAAFDADGNRLPPGEIGEVYLRRPSEMPPSLPVPRRRARARCRTAGRASATSARSTPTATSTSPTGAPT